MSRTSRLVAVAAGSLAVALIGVAPFVLAASTTRTAQLHGSMYAHKAVATARVTQVSTGDFRIQITATGLPEPAMIHVKPQRHVYPAWALDKANPHAMLEPIVLRLDHSTGIYSGNGVVMLQHVTRIVVTADKSARQHAPTTPEVIVLDSAGKAAM
jgi:hypothetical protein